jgi:hypothetical protein
VIDGDPGDAAADAQPALDFPAGEAPASSLQTEGAAPVVETDVEPPLHDMTDDE